MDIDLDIQLEMFRRMLSIRYFEQAVENLWKDKQVPGYCHSSIGQEGAVVGACMSLRDDDYITGTHRSHAHPIAKGADLRFLMAELLGKVTGICKGRGGSMHFADSSVGVISESAIVGGGIPLATGAGLSAQIRGTDQVGLCFFGDGAVNQGTFHESINMASIWKLPVIYFCENNGYAITTSLPQSHGQPSIAKRAEGYGIPGLAVDGQDVEAVYDVTFSAVQRARSGLGPTLIEAKTYRFDEHQIGLSVSGEPYRSESEISYYVENRDPVDLYRVILKTRYKEALSLNSLEQQVRDEVLRAVQFAKESSFPDPSTVYDYMYANPINYP